MTAVVLMEFSITSGDYSDAKNQILLVGSPGLLTLDRPRPFGYGCLD